MTKKSYKKEVHKVLWGLKSTKPKEYWGILNKCFKKGDQLGKITLQAFMNHFKKLSQKPVNEDIRTEFDPRNIDHSINEEIHANIYD